MLTRNNLEHELAWLDAGLESNLSAAARATDFHACSRRLQECALAGERAFLDSGLALLRQKYAIPDEAIAPVRARKRATTRIFPVG